LEIRREAAQPEAAIPVIMHVITDLGSGGAEYMLLRLVAASRKFRHVVVSLAGEGRLAEALRSAGAEVFALRMNRNLPSPGAIFRLARLIRRSRPVVLQTWLYHADLIGLLAAKLARFKPVAWNLRCSNMNLSRYRLSTRAIVKLLIFMSPWTDMVVVNSEAGCRWHCDIGYRPKYWELVSNGVDATVFRPDPEARMRWRQRLGVGEGDILVGMAARRDPMKDHEGMLRAAAIAARRQPGLAFVLAGRGVSRGDAILKRLADDVSAPVHLIDACDDLPGLDAALDVCVLSSAFGEGFPNVVAETMAAGVPCVVTDVGDSAAIVDTTGLVVLPGDPQALAEAITKLASDRDLRARLGEAARRRIETRYKLSDMVARYETLWQRLAAAD
jgi:glycosyltransferase involved in cell wall biosynthesis